MKPWVRVAGGVAGLGLLLFGTAAVAAARRGGGGRARGAEVFVRDRVLYGPGGFQYRLTDEDLLWLGRSVTREAGGNPEGTAAVIWAIVQYHALVLGPGGQRPKFSTLTAMIRAYSVPVIPGAAQAGSAWCQAHPRLCTEGLLQARQRIQRTPWSGLPEVVRDAVTRFAQGELPNPVPGAVDWDAAFTQDRSQTPLVHVAGNNFGVGRNRRLYRG